jgi:hypothetical protein
MPEYSDPDKQYTIVYPDNWLPLTHEGSPHISLASLTTGGFLKIEAYQFEHADPAKMQPEAALQALIECDRRSWPSIEPPSIQRQYRRSATSAYANYSRTESANGEQSADFGNTRVWVFSKGKVQVRCLYRCRNTDAGTDDEALDSIIQSLEIHDAPQLDVANFAQYYFSLLKRLRPHIATQPPTGLALALPDGQTVLLEQLYHHYLLQPERMDDLIESHIGKLDYCCDDVPDLTNYRAIHELLFPKVFRATSRVLPPNRLASWPGLSIGAVVQGSVFTYGVSVDRLKNWGCASLQDIYEQLLDNLYSINPIAPRGLRDTDGQTKAISYVDHPFCASFILFDDFYETTAHNLGTPEFLVGVPDPSCVSCFREDDPRFVVQHTALLRWDYHRSVERLSDTIYLVGGPDPRNVQPYDVLHCCPKKS